MINSNNLYKEELPKNYMNKKLNILKIMKTENCSYEEAILREKERTNLKEFF